MKHIPFILFITTLCVNSAALANGAHNLLLNKSSIEQQKVLAESVKSAGHECTGAIEAKFKFIEPQSDYAYWRVSCGGKPYLVEIKNDENGSTKILDCEKAKSLKIDCD